MNPLRPFDRRTHAIAASLLAIAASILVPDPAFAQDVVMRRPIPVTRTSTTAAWSMTPWVVYDGSTVVEPSRACGDYVERRDVSCKSPAGQVVDEYFCAGTPKPASSQPARHDAGCTYSWTTGDWVDPGAACTLKEKQTRQVSCLRDSDKASMPGSMCEGAKPDTVQEVQDLSTCTHSWDPGAWRDPGASCTNAERQTRDVACLRDLDKASVDASNCKPSDRPGDTQDVRDVSGCTHSWKSDPFVDPGSSCTRAETQTRTVTCRRSLDEELADDAACAATKPASTQVVEDYSKCGFTAVEPSDWTWSSTCSATATRTRTFKCQRSNDGGEIVDAAQCAAAGVPLTESVTEANLSNCSHGWRYSDFVDPGASCTAAETHTRTSWCERDLDGAIVSDGLCSGRTQQPLATNAGADYSGCGYSAVNWTGYTPDSTCSASATRTRTAQCRRGDGTIVAGSECTSRGIAVSETVAEANYSTCSNSWRGSGYVDPGASCGSETWTQAVSCRRDLDNALMADAACTGTRPSAAEVHTDHSACTFSAHDHGYGACDGTNRPHYWDCMRSDGTDGFPASQCGKSNPEYENCYSYAPTSTQSSCSNGSQTVTNSCRRSDGQFVATSFCGQPATSTQSCTSYSWGQGGFGGFGACQSDNKQYQYRDVYCQSNNGGNIGRVSDDLCVGAGGKPTNVNTQSCQYYSYRWEVGTWSDYSSHCSTNARRERAVWCYRNPDNAYMADQTGCHQTAAWPGWEEYAQILDQCGYTPGYGGYGACQPDNRSYASITSCTRSDGTPLGTAECTNRGSASQISQACSYYSYSGGYGGFGACQPDSRQYRTNSCTRSPDGAAVDPATYCGIPSSDSQPCTYVPPFRGVWVKEGAMYTANVSYSCGNGPPAYPGPRQNYINVRTNTQSCVQGGTYNTPKAPSDFGIACAADVANVLTTTTVGIPGNSAIQNWRCK